MSASSLRRADQKTATIGLLRERRLGRPMVLVDRPAPEADSVVADNRAGIGQALHHLVARGHRRIAFLGDLRSIWTATERHAAYVEALAAQGIILETAPTGDRP